MQDDNTSYMAQIVRWRAEEGQFSEWHLDGVGVAPDGTLRLDPATAQLGTDLYPPAGYRGGNFYNGDSFLVGEAISPAAPSPFGFSEAVASWNAHTPPGSWLEVHLRVQLDKGWTKWYNMGVWASDSSTVQRHSVEGQGDEDANVFTDTLVLREGLTADALQLELRLFSESRDASPTVYNASVAISTAPELSDILVPGNAGNWNSLLQVPQYSQMVYPDGGRVWCSAVSVSMVMAYWENDLHSLPGRRVRATIDGVYDHVYGGHGNWAFNVAYAGSPKLQAYVARFTGMDEIERWVAAGVPVVISYGWGVGQLVGAPLPSSTGHLAVMVGFDASGDPIVNDPAASDDATVRRVYRRSELEKLWLEHSGGTVYLIYPPDYSVPA